MQKTLHSLGSCTENFPFIQISSIVSVNFTSLWHKCQSVLLGKLHLCKTCWELWLSDDQPHSDYNGQWQRALCMLAVLQSSQPNPQRNKNKIGKCMLQVQSIDAWHQIWKLHQTYFRMANINSYVGLSVYNKCTIFVRKKCLIIYHG